MAMDLNTAARYERKAPETHLSDQLPTPGQSMPFSEQHVTQGSYQGGRGIRLCDWEELVLIKLCKDNMKNYNVRDHPKSFWISLADLFVHGCGRVYSWQSCRRRIYNYVINRKTYWAALDKGLPPPEAHLNDDVSREVDKWIWECDAKWDAAQRKKEQLENEQAAALREKERSEYMERRRKCLKRVQGWIETVPAPDEVEPLPLHWGEVPYIPKPRYRSSRSRSRSRSRSPHRTEDCLDSRATYRQRPRLQGSSRTRDPGRTGRNDHRPRDIQCNDGVPTYQELTTWRHPQEKWTDDISEVEEADDKDDCQMAIKSAKPVRLDRDDDEPYLAADAQSAREHLPMETTSAEFIQPVEEASPALSAPGAKDAGKDRLLVPHTKADCDDAVKSASATFSKRIDELAENQALHNQNFRRSLKAIESAVHVLIGKVVGNTFERTVDDSGELGG